MSTGFAVLSTGFKGFARYLGGVLGADAYTKYLEHHRACGHAGEPLTEREFWRDRTDRQDSNPQGRCC
ncbi:YbdD/YjiX family protein [Arthrobacter sp. AD-310]